MKLQRIELFQSFPHPKIKREDRSYASCYEAPEYDIEDIGSCVRVTKEGETIRIYPPLLKGAIELTQPEATRKKR